MEVKVVEEVKVGINKDFSIVRFVIDFQVNSYPETTFYLYYFPKEEKKDYIMALQKNGLDKKEMMYKHLQQIKKEIIDLVRKDDKFKIQNMFHKIDFFPFV